MSLSARRRTPCAAVALSHLSSSACGLLRGSVVEELDEKDKKLQATQRSGDNIETDGEAFLEISVSEHDHTAAAETAPIGGEIDRSALEVLDGDPPNSWTLDGVTMHDPSEHNSSVMRSVLRDYRRKRKHGLDIRPGTFDIDYDFEGGPLLSIGRYYGRREPAPDDAAALWDDVLETVSKEHAIHRKRIEKVKTTFTYVWHLQLYKDGENVKEGFIDSFAESAVAREIEKAVADIFPGEKLKYRIIATFDGVEESGQLAPEADHKATTVQNQVMNFLRGFSQRKDKDGEFPTLDSVKVYFTKDS